MSDGKYSYCPDCGRKGVCWAPRRSGEDNYSCRHQECPFYFFALSGSPIDDKQRRRWELAQAFRRATWSVIPPARRVLIK